MLHVLKFKFKACTLNRLNTTNTNVHFHNTWKQNEVKCINTYQGDRDADND